MPPGMRALSRFATCLLLALS
ncbi:MAG: hypothetical protein QOC72_982, partial [Methylobacteriaceae bacterium]|nr:hypothetical protein [Methylobacteriaceae bacterium]